MHSAIKGLAYGGGILRKDVKKGIDYLRSRFGDEVVNSMIKEAEDSGRSLAEVADERVLEAVQMARQQTPEARFKIADNIEQINRGTVDRNDAFINEMFGNKSGFVAKEEAMQAAKEKARPLFNELENMGDLANAQPKPTREQLVSYPAESKFNPNGNYTKEQAIQKLRERANQANTSIFNDELTYKGDRYGANHFVQNKDIPNIRTINNTINKPDISYSNTVNGNPRDFYVKKYHIPQESDLLDFVITQDGKYFDKFKTDTNYVSNQINMPVKDLSFNRRVSVQEPISGGQNITSVSNIPSLGEIVKGNDVIADAIIEKEKLKICIAV